MNTGENFEVVKDDYFLNIKNSKDRPVVEKARFAIFASALPRGVRIFSYEGPDDKLIYDYWIRRLRVDFRYEPYVCKNKCAVLELFDSLERDRTGLGNEVFFFVDCDFDFLQGRAPDNKIFVTDRYSVENYVVCSSLLDDLLKIEFHCNGHPEHRARIVAHFEKIYVNFLEITKDINLRIFISRRLNIRQLNDLPVRINALAEVTLLDVAPREFSVSDLVRLEREPSDEELVRLRTEFERIDPMSGYRGKFALLFFVRWLCLLRRDRLSSESVLFAGIPVPENGINGGFSFATLAPKAPAPEKLSEFLDAIEL
ncbi:DUF4435 domain-containing protein [Burkholderia gladioli]|uniref:DUF4435 domain-containing protein n=1 Tax=Burkholderia gladioli TaxID=28095 RepID=UPI00163E824C|nr:DUF4435 domain-containing protein [Burkholderia gladioli]